MFYKEGGVFYEKIIKIILIVILVIYAVSATLAAVAFREECDSLYMKNYELNSQNAELLMKETDAILETASMIDFQSFANCVSEENYVSKVLEESVVIVVCAEGRTTNEMITEISKYSFAIQSALESHEFSTAVILVISNSNEVLFGFTITRDGEAVPFLSRDYEN